MKFAIYDSLVELLNSEGDKNKHVTIFCKGLYLFLLLKILLLFPLLGDVSQYKPFIFTSAFNYLLFAPLGLTTISQGLFLYLFAGLLMAALILRINYILGFLVCWFSISLSRLFLPVINGSDLVLNLFLIIAIFLPVHPRFGKGEWVGVQNLISNAALLLGQIQLALIYLLSGYDKLMSQAWRSGAAINSMNHLKFYHNPYLNLDLSEGVCLALSWAVILFELSFPLLIWLRVFRRPLLILGVMFHLVIVFYLGLFDFGLVMILCYGIYLPFKKSAGNGAFYGG